MSHEKLQANVFMREKYSNNHKKLPWATETMFMVKNQKEPHLSSWKSFPY